MGERKFRLVNVVSCEVWELDCCNSAEGDIVLDMVVDQMLKYYFRPTVTKSDQEFIDEALAVSGQSPVFCGDMRSLYADAGGDLLLGFSKTGSVVTSECGGAMGVVADERLSLKLDPTNEAQSDPAFKIRSFEHVEVIDLISSDEDEERKSRKICRLR
jgi:hypothetical protein